MNPNGNASPMDGLPLQPGSNWIRSDDYHGFSSFSTAWYISYSMKWYIRFSIIIGSFFYQSPFSGRLPCYVRVRGNRTTNQSNALISRYNYVFINCHSWKQFDHLDPLKTGYFTTHVSTLLPSLKKNMDHPRDVKFLLPRELGQGGPRPFKIIWLEQKVIA